MRWLRSLFRKSPGPQRAESTHRKLNEETRFQLSSRIKGIFRRGARQEEARQGGETQAGHLIRIEELRRELRGGGWLGTLWQDLRYGMRMLMKNPGFSFVAVFTLALGISAITVVFSVVDAFLLRPLPFYKPEALAHVWRTDRQQNLMELRASVSDFADWREQNTAFQELGAYYYRDSIVTLGDTPIRAQVGLTTPNMFNILGVRPMKGRVFLTEEGQAGRERVVVLSYGFWQRSFASDQDILGKRVTINGIPHEVIGVMSRDFIFPLKATQMWTPLVISPQSTRRDEAGSLLVVGRLRTGVTLGEAQSGMEVIARRLEQQYPATNTGRGARVVPLREALLFFYDLMKVAMGILFLAITFVLLIVCANIGILQLVRAGSRTKEIAIRMALGAGRPRLIRQLLTECLVLAVVSAAACSLLAYWVVSLIGSAIPEDLYRAGEVKVDGNVLMFTLFVTLMTAFLFGFAPALQVTQLNLTESLKEGQRNSSGGDRGHRWRNTLVVAQIVLSILLLGGSTLMIQSFIRLQNVDVGFTTDHILTLELVLPNLKYPGQNERNAFDQEVLQKLSSLPLVESAAATSPLPLNFETMPKVFTIEGRAPTTVGEKLSADCFWVTSDYFETMGIRVLRGRAFTPRDDQKAPGVVVINHRMADKYWPGEDPVGKQVRIEADEGGDRLAAVIGVVGDTKHFLLNEEAAPLIYVPQSQESRRHRFLIVRTGGDPHKIIAGVSNEIKAVDKDLPIANIRSMRQVVDESSMLWGILAAVLGGLGFGSLVLAAMGLYGVISYSVTQRTHEIGIRIALGARKQDILKLILKQGMKLAAIGVTIGLAGAFALSYLMRKLLYDVTAFNPVTFLGVPLLLGLVALLACYIPTRRAMKADPTTSLRYG